MLERAPDGQNGLMRPTISTMAGSLSLRFLFSPAVILHGGSVQSVPDVAQSVCVHPSVRACVCWCEVIRCPGSSAAQSIARVAHSHLVSMCSMAHTQILHGVAVLRIRGSVMDGIKSPVRDWRCYITRSVHLVRRKSDVCNCAELPFFPGT